MTTETHCPYYKELWAQFDDLIAKSKHWHRISQERQKNPPDTNCDTIDSLEHAQHMHSYYSGASDILLAVLYLIDKPSFKGSKYEVPE